MVITAAWVVNGVIGKKSPTLETPEQKIEYIRKLDLPLEAKYFKEILVEDSANLDIHYHHLVELMKICYDGQYSDDLLFEYKKVFSPYTFDSDTSIIDIGHLGMGVLYYMQAAYDEGNDSANYADGNYHFSAVSDTNMQYLHYFKAGFAYLHNDIEEALHHLRLEIAKEKSAERESYRLLHQLFDYTNDTVALTTMAANERVWPLLSSSKRQELQFNYGTMRGYFQAKILRIEERLNSRNLMVNSMVFLIWFWFLLVMNKDRSSNLPLMFFTFVLGVLGCFMVTPGYDFVHSYLGVELNDTFWNDLLYCIAVIGGLEELVKIVPFLFILVFTNVIKRPYDYILYASLSALGFAMLENLGKYDNIDMFFVNRRALMTVMGHMFFTSLIAFGLMQNKFRFQNKFHPAFVFAIFFLMACISHGLYDLPIISDLPWSVSEKMLLTLVIVVLLYFALLKWLRFLAGPLPKSPQILLNESFRYQRIALIFVIAFGLVYLGEYLYTAWLYGAAPANSWAILHSFFNGSILVLVILYLPVLVTYRSYMDFNQSVNGELDVTGEADGTTFEGANNELV